MGTICQVELSPPKQLWIASTQVRLFRASTVCAMLTRAAAAAVSALHIGEHRRVGRSGRRGMLYCSSCAVEQGQPHWTKSSVEAARDVAIRTQLKISSNVREFAMFNLALHSKLRAYDLTRLRAGCLSRQSCRIPCHSHAVENATASAIRNNRADGV